ncbi:MAG: phosphorylase [Bacteroidetes bacterium]|nr:MAG: phosphorylase [Bacteroidota bacterium]
MHFSPADLILNQDGSVYHLHLRPEHIAQNIITVGDPDRVAMVSSFFDSIEFKTQKREFVTHTGLYKNKRLTVISTGIGTDNIEIVMNELDALINIDLEKRQAKAKTQALNIIRIGTSGTLSPNIPLDSLLVSQQAIGLDTLMCFYELSQTENENKIGKELQNSLQIPFQPYIVTASDALQKQIAYDLIAGNTLTCCGFYAPQGRKMRYAPKIENYLEKLQNFSCLPISNFEMETAGYYALGRILGHNMLSLNAIVANRAKNTFSIQAEKTISNLIEKVLDRI